LVSLLVYTPISAFGALWGASYIEAALPGTSASEAGWVVAMLFIGIAVMGPIVGRISDRSGNRAGLMGIGSIVMAVSLTGLVFLPSMNLAVAFVLVLLVGAATSIQVVTYAAGMELQPPSRHGAAVAFVNFSAMFSGLLMQPLIGEVLNLERPAGEATNSIENYQVALLTLPICAVIAVVLCGVLVIARRRSS
jgi:MFS family permease